jgi:hypothetical protein
MQKTHPALAWVGLDLLVTLELPSRPAYPLTPAGPQQQQRQQHPQGQVDMS